MADCFACMPRAEWPALDRELWTQGFRGNDLFEAIGPAGRWRPRTVETVREGYGHALAWLERRGLLDRRQSPDARWTRERLRGYVEEMQARLRPATVQNRLISLERALAVLVPRSDRSTLRAAIRNATVRPDAARKRSRLQDPARLVALGFELMSDAERGVTRTGARTPPSIAMACRSPCSLCARFARGTSRTSGSERTSSAMGAPGG